VGTGINGRQKTLQHRLVDVAGEMKKMAQIDARISFLKMVTRPFRDARDRREAAPTTGRSSPLIIARASALSTQTPAAQKGGKLGLVLCGETR